MAGGVLDSVVARVESYFGEFLQSRQGLLEAKNKIDSALTQAQSQGFAKIGEKTFPLADLIALSQENDALLARNSELQTQIMDFKDKVSAVQAGATSVMDILVPEDAYYGGPGFMGNPMGAIPVMIPAAALVAVGAALATAVYLFLGNARKHIAEVAGSVGAITTDILLLAVAGLAAYWYFVKRGK